MTLNKKSIVMASIRFIDNNTKSSVFDNCSYEGENYSDTRNTRKYINSKKDPQKVKWQAQHKWKPETDPIEKVLQKSHLSVSKEKKAVAKREKQKFVVFRSM